MKRQAWTLLRVIMALALLLVSVGPGGRTARADELMAILGVDVENLDAPFGGEKPDYSATVEVGEGCRLGAASGEGWKNGVMWYDVTEDTARAARSSHRPEGAAWTPEYRRTASARSSCGANLPAERPSWP